MTEQDQHDQHEPQRLASGEDGLLKSLIVEGRKETVTPSQLAAVAAKLGPILGSGGPSGGGGGGGAPGPGTGPSATGAAGKAAGMTLATKLGVAAVGVAMLATVLHVVTSESEAVPVPAGSASSGPSPADSASAAGPTVPLPDLLLPPKETPVAADTSRWDEVDSAPPPEYPRTGKTLEPDLRLLTEAQATLKSDPAKALALCGEHAKRFPTSKFSQERDTLAIVALVGMGKMEEASQRAEAFKKSYPDSPNVRRIETILATP